MSSVRQHPGVPTLAAALDEALLADAPEPALVLDDGPNSTSLGLKMAGDARRVARGELTAAEFWARHDTAAAAEFGDAYRATPDPDIGRTRAGGGLCAADAAGLQCSVGDIEPLAATEGERFDTGKRWGMVLDLQKCVGCDSCTVACKAENRTPPNVTYNVVMEVEHGTVPDTRRVNMPRPCMQCENPPCVQVCPVSATYKMENGIVDIDYDRCIGCRYCLVACPYGARYSDFGLNYADESGEDGQVTSPEYGVRRGERAPFKSPIGNARKCSFCYHRLGRGEEPACVETCIGDARYFGDLNDEDSEVSRLAGSIRSFRLKEEDGTEPNVYYLR